MSVNSLGPEAVFWIGPDRFNLIYFNRVPRLRRGARAARDRRGRRFARHERWNISPNTRVEYEMGGTSVTILDVLTPSEIRRAGGIYAAHAGTGPGEGAD